jgi:hypothetical protein
MPQAHESIEPARDGKRWLAAKQYFSDVQVSFFTEIIFGLFPPFV